MKIPSPARGVPPRRPSLSALALAGLGVAALAVPALAISADNDLSTLADKLIELRGEVEGLHDDIEAQQQEHRNRMSSLSQRRAELQAQIQRQELDAKKLQRELEELRSEATDVSAEIAELRPMAKDASQRLQSRMKTALPYMTEERVADLATVDSKLAAEEISAARAFNQIWTFFEDELRLARESEMFRQTITVDGEEQLADVVRLGMVSMYFRTGDERFGYAVKGGSGWTYQVAAGGEARLIEDLFDSFERQVRTGFFEVPNALPGSN